MDFEQRLQKAIRRGERRGDAKRREAEAAGVNEEELKRIHGQYRLQPIHVDDLAALAVEQAHQSENRVIEAIGPETFTYRELVKTIGAIIGCPRPVVSVPPRLGYWVGRLFGALKGDVVITREEIQGLMEDRLFVDAPPAGAMALTRWVAEHRATLGVHYASELARRHRATAT